MFEVEAKKDFQNRKKEQEDCSNKGENGLQKSEILVPLFVGIASFDAAPPAGCYFRREEGVGGAGDNAGTGGVHTEHEDEDSRNFCGHKVK